MLLALRHIWNSVGSASPFRLSRYLTYQNGLGGTSTIEGVGHSESEFGLECKESSGSQLHVPTRFSRLFGRSFCVREVFYLFTSTSQPNNPPFEYLVKHRYSIPGLGQTPTGPNANHPSHALLFQALFNAATVSSYKSRMLTALYSSSTSNFKVPIALKF